MSPAWVLVLAGVGISFGGPLVRLSGMDPLALAAWRLLLSLPLVFAPALAGGQWREWRGLSARDLGLALLAGVTLALHFWAWNASIGMTSIAASTTLVNTQPLFIVLLSAWFLRERPTGRQALGIAVALAGATVIARGGVSGAAHGPRAALPGDLLAFSAAAAAAAYYVVGRHLRRTLGIWSYASLVYALALAALAAMALAEGAPLGAPLREPRGLACAAGLALGPMLIGHTGMNWALRHYTAPVVNLAALAEPVGATLLAMALPGIRETPGAVTLAGGAIALFGVGMGLFAKAQPGPAA